MSLLFRNKLKTQKALGKQSSSGAAAVCIAHICQFVSMSSLDIQSPPVFPWKEQWNCTFELDSHHNFQPLLSNITHPFYGETTQRPLLVSFYHPRPSLPDPLNWNSQQNLLWFNALNPFPVQMPFFLSLALRSILRRTFFEFSRF